VKYSFLYIVLFLISRSVAAEPLGLPPLPVPENNTQSEQKIALGDKLFNDTRFSATGEVSCATCHDPQKAFTDLLPVSEGINGLKGTRSAPTVINAAYNKTQFWDGREPTLEAQSKQPFLNPVEMALPDHDYIIDIVRRDPEYVASFRAVFNVSAAEINIDQVAMAIAAFERTRISGDTPFDSFYFGDDQGALTEAQKRGLEVYLNEGRCVSCHVIEQTSALFTDHLFHNIGVGFKTVKGKIHVIAEEFIKSKRKGTNVDFAVLSSSNVSQLGRFAITEDLTDMGAFKTPTLRNIDKTAPYMHDGSLEKLEDVVTFYNNGGRLAETDPLDDFLSGGIRPLNLTDQQQQDLVEFMKALTGPEYQ
jgi:cytochrome c peroxidase